MPENDLQIPAEEHNFFSKDAESKNSYKKQDVGQDCHGRNYDDKDRRTKCCFGKIFNMTHRVRWNNGTRYNACNWMVVIEYGFI